MLDMGVMDTNRKTFSIRQTIPNSTLVQKFCNYPEMTKAKEKKALIGTMHVQGMLE